MADEKKRKRKRRRPKPTEPKPPKKTKCTEAVTAQRVDELLRMRLDGAEFWDVREYVREKEKEEGSLWFLGNGETPYSDATLWYYLTLVNNAIDASCLENRRQLMKAHLAKRRNLYTKALLSGDYRTALACARDEAELIGIYETGKLLKELSAVLSAEEMEQLEALLSKGMPADGSRSHTTPRNPAP